MDWEISLYYIIPALFLLLLVFPIFFEVRVSYNPIFNRGVIALFIFKKRIFYYIITLHKNGIEMQNETETKFQKLEFQSQQFAVMEEFGKQLKDKIKLKKCNVFYNIGTGDGFSSALVCGVLNQFLMHAFLIIKSHKPTASLCVYDTITYNKQMCELAVVAQISISFFDVVYSYIYSVIISKKK